MSIQKILAVSLPVLALGLVVFPVHAQAPLSADARARDFLAARRGLAGLPRAEGFRTLRVRPDGLGQEHVLMSWERDGITVVPSQISVHLSGGRATDWTGRIPRDAESVSTLPTLPAASALDTARALVQRAGLSEGATFGAPALNILNRGLLGHRDKGPSRLAWFVNAVGPALDDFMWIAADGRDRGRVLLRFSQLGHARNRGVYDSAGGSALPGTLVRGEGGAATGDTDVDSAYQFMGDFYDYFSSVHGRDSFDNAGAALTGSANYVGSAGPCPGAIAFWAGPASPHLIFCQGENGARNQDVVAHELTHGIVERTANLFLYMQSGALAESYADIFGETIDQQITNTNDGAPDSDLPADRWTIGEGLASPLRSMKTPNVYGDPGRMGDAAYFRCEDSDTDRGGINHNSGVPNHAYQLMVDGGTYNGKTITGIGLTKAAKIMYRTLATYLFPGADFLDNYRFVNRSCKELVGTDGITTTDCTNVKLALDAVEMSKVWPCAPTQAAVPAFCPAGKTRQDVFLDDLESGPAGWRVNTISGVDLWTPFDAFAVSGTHDLYGKDLSIQSESSAEMNHDVAVPAGARMQFNHSYGFDNDIFGFWDGGRVEYSTDGGTVWKDGIALRLAGANYGGTLDATTGNPLGGLTAFVGDSWGYTATQLNLGTLSGQNVRFRFRMGVDASVSDYGWFVDDVAVYTCPNVTLSVANATLGAEGNAGTVNLPFTVSLNGSTTVAVTATYLVTAGTAAAGADYTAVSGTVTVPAGATSAKINVPIKGDAKDEPNETFTVKLASPVNAVFLKAQATGTITDDDPLPGLTIVDKTVTEGDAAVNAIFNVKLAPASGRAVTVDYQTSPGSALTPADFATRSGQLVFAVGKTLMTVAVPIVGDNLTESAETFTVNLSNPVNADIVDGTATGTINDND